LKDHCDSLMTSKTKPNNQRHSNFDAAYKNVSDMCNVQNMTWIYP
jgi:hypothetical protein